MQDEGREGTENEKKRKLGNSMQREKKFEERVQKLHQWKKTVLSKTLRKKGGGEEIPPERGLSVLAERGTILGILPFGHTDGMGAICEPILHLPRGRLLPFLPDGSHWGEPRSARGPPTRS